MGFFSGFSKLGKLKSSLTAMSFARVLAVMGAGTLGQRVTLLLGTGIIVFAIFQALPWFGMAIGGALLCWFAVRDFDRLNPQ